MSKHLTILAVEGYFINENEIYDIYQDYKRNTFNQLFPYTINNNESKKNLIDTSCYLQFVGRFGKDNPKEYLLLNFKTNDNVLLEEISNMGYESLFEHIDFNKIISNFKFDKYKDMWKILKSPYYLIVQMEYIGGYDHYYGGYDYDLEIDIVGYLDSNLEKVIFDKNI